MPKKEKNDGNVITVDIAYTKVRRGISLSFGIELNACEVSEIVTLSGMMVKFVKDTYGRMILGNFLAKTTTPVLYGQNEKIYLIWNFIGDDDKKTLNLLKKYKIKEIEQ